MDAHTILRIKPSLTRYLHEFDGCFGRSNTRAHLSTYVSGQLSDLRRKSVEPMADAAGIPPRTLQEFLSLSRWDETMMRDRLQQRVARRHPHGQSVGVIDETSFVKKGDQTAPGYACNVSIAGRWASRRIAWSACIWVTRRRSFTACWTATCTCRKKPGTKTAIAVGPRAFPRRWFTGPSGGLLWNNTNAPWTTACGLGG